MQNIHTSHTASVQDRLLSELKIINFTMLNSTEDVPVIHPLSANY